MPINIHVVKGNQLRGRSQSIGEYLGDVCFLAEANGRGSPVESGGYGVLLDILVVALGSQESLASAKFMEGGRVPECGGRSAPLREGLGHGDLVISEATWFDQHHRLDLPVIPPGHELRGILGQFGQIALGLVMVQILVPVSHANKIKC